MHGLVVISVVRAGGLRGNAAGAEHAAQLRLFDEGGKKKGGVTPPLEYSKPFVMRALPS
eukprot:COSAG01_NODE_883_length_12927_cov_10.710789_5_plen_59_part_00